MVEIPIKDPGYPPSHLAALTARSTNTLALFSPRFHPSYLSCIVLIAMDKMKEESVVRSLPVSDTYVDQYGDDDDNIDPSVPTKYRGTAADKREMKVIGKTQVLRVRTLAIESQTAADEDKA